MELDNKTKEILEYVQGLFNKEVFLVGGCCRDLIMGIEPHDYDFCSALTTEEVKEQLKGKHRAILIGERHGTVMFIAKGQEIEITTFRSDTYKNGSRKPECKFGTSLENDLNRRDFTCNSLAISCKTLEVIDNHNGINDIKSGIIKCVGIPKHRFKEDPLRILRAIRFCAKYEFIIEENTEKAIKKQIHTLLRISQERWVQEIDKMLLNDNETAALGLLFYYRVFNFIIPDLARIQGYDQNSLYHDYNLLEHTLDVVYQAKKNGEDLDTLWACLLHDIGKPPTRVDRLRQYGNNKDVDKMIDHINKNFKSSQQVDRFIDLNGNLCTAHYIHHERVGAEMASMISDYLKFSNNRKKLIVDLIKNHLKKDCPIKKYDDMSKSAYSKIIDKKC